jgi:hypothetical protein
MINENIDHNMKIANKLVKMSQQFIPATIKEFEKNGVQDSIMVGVYISTSDGAMATSHFAGSDEGLEQFIKMLVINSPTMVHAILDGLKEAKTDSPAVAKQIEKHQREFEGGNILKGFFNESDE